MDGRIALLDLPAEMISHEICKWLPLEALLQLRQSCKTTKQYADVFIQYELANMPLFYILNNDYNHFTHLCSIIKKNPTLLKPLNDPHKLLVLCLQLQPIGLLRLSILFSIFHRIIYEPIRKIANSNEKNWFTAFICCAILTPDINSLDLTFLDQAIWWLDTPSIKKDYAAIHTCLVTIKRVRETLTYIDKHDLPDTPCYLNLQEAELDEARLNHQDLQFSNLRAAKMTHATVLLANLHHTYMKDIELRWASHWSTHFFNLNDQTTTLRNQLNMLDYQLKTDEKSYRLDESIANDLMSQISELDDPAEKQRAWDTANTHPFFTRRKDNVNIQVAFHKAYSELTKPSTGGFFTRRTLRLVQHKPTDFHAPSPGS